MSLSVYNIKKWIRMLTGHSVLHVHQGVGRCIKSVDSFGYYNDLTEKVLMQPEYVYSDAMPLCETETGEYIEFPVAIFQFGLGCYDLFLIDNNQLYKKKFLQCADWAVVHQGEMGEWLNFSYIYPKHPLGAMCQGEAASLLIRAYKVTNDPKYLQGAKKSIDFMLYVKQNDGISRVYDNKLYLFEYSHLPLVLNGWIFASWGIYDLSKFFPEYKIIFDRTVKTILDELPKFDNGYWSLYDAAGMITSPFYHNLHIAQMEAMYQITGEEKFKEYEQRFKKYNSNAIGKTKAFVVKAIQKLKEK